MTISLLSNINYYAYNNRIDFSQELVLKWVDFNTFYLHSPSL